MTAEESQVLALGFSENYNKYTKSQIQSPQVFRVNWTLFTTTLTTGFGKSQFRFPKTDSLSLRFKTLCNKVPQHHVVSNIMLPITSGQTPWSIGVAQLAPFQHTQHSRAQEGSRGHTVTFLSHTGTHLLYGSD
jgi:hypothetical protein